MSRMFRLALGGLLPCLIAAQTAPAAIEFDPQRYMAVSEIHPGMTGYGLSVFSGDKIERFDVQVISILKNFNPGADVILIRFSGQGLENTGAIEGMSGSPIYLKDDQGRFRMIGAFAYGWSLAKDPIAGVQPIQYMLQINNPPPATQPVNPAPSPIDGASAGNSPAAGPYSTDLRSPAGTAASHRLPALSNPENIAGPSSAAGDQSLHATASDRNETGAPVTFTWQQFLTAARQGDTRPNALRPLGALADGSALPQHLQSMAPTHRPGRADPLIQSLTSPAGTLFSDPYSQLQPLATPVSMSLRSLGLDAPARWTGPDHAPVNTAAIDPLAGTTLADASAPSTATSPAPASTAPASTLPADPTAATQAAGMPFQPGSAIAVPLLTGDVDYSAVGTVTEVHGDQVLAFGHSFNSEGVVSLPISTAYINGIVSNLASSFKLGESREIVGALRADEMVGVGGHVGAAPKMMPIDLTVEYANEPAHQMHFNAVIHPDLTRRATQVAAEIAITARHNLPEEAFIEYDLTVSYANGRSLRIHNTSGGSMGYEPLDALGMAVYAGMSNPYKRVPPTAVTGTIKITPEMRLGRILSINAPRKEFQPGQTVKAYITYRPWRSPETIMPVEFVLPADLPEGQYTLSISDSDHYMNEEMLIAPYRFVSQNPDDLMDMVQDIYSVPRSALYLRLTEQADGVSIGRVAMPRLPGTRRQIMLESGRSNVTPLASSIVRSIATPIELLGSESFTITINKHARVQVGQPASEGPAAPQNQPAPEPHEPAHHAVENTPAPTD